MYEVSYGSKHAATKDLNTTQIAKLFREEIKAAIKAGELPKGLKVSIRSEYFSGGSAIRCKVTAIPFPLYNPEHLKWEQENPHGCYRDAPTRLTEEASKLLKELDGRLAAYNFDGSESQVDYFHVRFYGSVDYCYDLERLETARYLAQVAADIVMKPEPEESVETQVAIAIERRA